MPEKGHNPTADGDYLTDANYYRLGYQLVAQLMHRKDTDQTHEPAVETASDVLFGEWVRRKPGRIDVEDQATKLLTEAEAILELYAKRQKARKWVIFRGSLTVKEKRLVKFLHRTVNPCLTIVIAASIRPRDPADAEARVQPLRERAELTRGSAAEQADGLSYRSLYNLACYEANAVESPEGNTLRYLAAALDQAPGNRRVELAKWAKNDPSLKSVAYSKPFKQLLGSFAWASPSPIPGSDSR